MISNTSIIPSPAVSVVGRHNSGKTTLVEAVIARLVADGLDIGSVKHHGHVGFDIDIPGKDSYRHRAAGASETVISTPGQVACIKTISGEAECSQLVKSMPGHDLVIVEGYRKSGLPSIEVMRAANTADTNVAQIFLKAAQSGQPLTTDFIQAARASHTPAPDPGAPVDAGKIPQASTVAVVSDIPSAHEAAGIYGIPAFNLNDVDGLCAFLRERYARPRISVVLQAGGESRRMGHSKALVSFEGRPLIMRLIERVAPAADEIIVTTNEAKKLAFLQQEYPQLSLRLETDRLDYRGALPGMLTALSAAHNEQVAIIACDMVFASPRLIVAESQEMQRTGADVVVPVNRNGFEPFHALYRRSSCLPQIEVRLKQGESRAQAIFPFVSLCEFPQAKVLETEPGGRCFINVNTPDDLDFAERLAEKDTLWKPALQPAEHNRPSCAVKKSSQQAVSQLKEDAQRAASQSAVDQSSFSQTNQDSQIEECR